MAFLNAIGPALRSLRYNLVTKSLAILSAMVITFSSMDPLIVAAAIVIGCLLLWSSARTIKRTFDANWFLRYQTNTIDRVVESKPVKELMRVQKVFADGSVDTLDPTQVSNVATGISTSIILNRALYFWAYQLQKYKQARLGVLFNLLAYVWLFIGSLLAFGLLNLAVLKVGPNQFSYDNYPSNLAMMVYGVSTLALNDGAGITSSGAAAHLLRLAAGLFGIVFLVTVSADLLLTWRRERDDEALKSTVLETQSSSSGTGPARSGERRSR